MNTVYGSLRLRPTRIGFLVSPANMTALRRVMQVCTCLWGGAYNPIIPVCDELPEQWTQRPFPNPTGLELATGYLDFFEPDVFVESETGLAARAGVSDLKLGYAEPRVVSLDAFFEADQSKQPKIPFGLGILDLYQNLYDREFKFVRRHDQQVVLFETGTDHDAFIEAAFGGFPPEGFLAPLARAYREAFDPQPLAPDADSWLKVTREGRATPLRFTAHGIRRDHDGYSYPTLFVLDPNSRTDLIDLWNLRQFAANVLPVNVLWVSEARDSIRQYITANYRALPGNPHGVMIHTTVQFGRSFSEERAKEIVIALFDGLPQGSWSLKLWYDGIWHIDRTEDRVARPRRARLSAASSDLELPVSEEPKDKSVRFPSLAPEFASLYGDDKARWVNVLTLHTYVTDESIALVLPADITRQTLARIRLGGDGALASREGLVLPQHFKSHREYLHLLSGTEVLVESLAARGIAAQPSDAGRIASQVLKSVGGFAGASLLAHRETLETLDKMAKSVRQYKDGKTEEFQDRASPVKLWQGLVERRNNQRRWPGSVTLDSFIRAGILRLGISLQCPNCLNHNWCGLREMDEEVKCDRCMKPFDFPQGSLNFNHTPWQFRVVGPFAVPDFAGGAYTTVLALRVFAENLDSDAQLTLYVVKTFWTS
jgi:hypothetical protein